MSANPVVSDSSRIQIRATPGQAACCTALGISCLLFTSRFTNRPLPLATSLLPSAIWAYLMVRHAAGLQGRLESIREAKESENDQWLRYQELLEEASPASLYELRGEKELLGEVLTTMHAHEFSRKTLIRLMERASRDEERDLIIRLIDEKRGEKLIERWIVLREPYSLLEAIDSWPSDEERRHAYNLIPVKTLKKVLENREDPHLVGLYTELSQTEEG